MKKWQKIALGVAVAIPAVYFWKVSLALVCVVVQAILYGVYLYIAYNFIRLVRDLVRDLLL